MQSNKLEIIRFLKDNKLFILVGSIIFAIVFALALTFFLTEEASTELPAEDTNVEDSEELILLEEFSETNPAYFQVFIEMENGESFTNASLMNYYFNLENTKSMAYEETGIDLNRVEEAIKEAELSDELSTIRVNRNEDNSIITVTLSTLNEEDNQELAEYFYDLIMNDGIDFLNDKTVYSLQEPVLFEQDESLDEDGEMVSEVNDTQEASTSSLLVKLAQNLLVGLVIGAVIATGLMFIKALFGKKLNYVFSYEVGKDDKHFVYDKTLSNKDNLLQFVSAPYGSKKIILSEGLLNAADKNKFQKGNELSFNEESKIQLIESESLVNIPVDIDFSEIIIVIKPYSTSRNWYKTQKELKELFEVPTKIIQLNN